MAGDAGFVPFTRCFGNHRSFFVFFLVDDLSQRDLRCYGSTLYETPQFEGLAKLDE
jgi:hypothetical protein